MTLFRVVAFSLAANLLISCSSNGITPTEGAAAGAKGMQMGIKGGVLLIGGILASPFGTEAIETTMQGLNTATKPVDRATDGVLNSVLKVSGSTVRIVDSNRFRDLAQNRERYRPASAPRVASEVQRRTGQDINESKALYDSMTGELILMEV